MPANSSEPFIAIDFWIPYSDIVIERNNNHQEYENKINELLESKDDPVVLFLKTDLLPAYFELLFSLEKPYILITASNDDHCPPYLNHPPPDETDEMKYMALLEKPEMLFWFAKNPCIKHRKLSAYPLGPKWQWKTTRFFGEDKAEHLSIYNKLCKTPRESMSSGRSSKPNLLYLNFNNTTGNPLYSSHRGIRNSIKQELLKRFSWNESQNFNAYMHTLSTHKFCISPPGRGIDTHRCWEALMMGTIPLVCSTPIDYLFENLPVIIIQDWTTVTEEFLNTQYEIILKNIDQYNFDILYTPYWTKMLSSKKNDHDVGCPPL